MGDKFPDHHVPADVVGGFEEAGMSMVADGGNT
jgi:hypothetical protein